MTTPSTTPTLYIEGPALWAPTLPGWDVARAALRGEGAPADPPVKRPAPQVLAPAERRRAPDSVAIALEVAAAAVAAAGRQAVDLPCIFASAHGDLAINDYMCATLASEPTLLSPTKFHNSVHNAAVGYWTIGTGCMASSNSVSSFEATFAAGLLEAAAQCACDQQAVLLTGFDVQAVGPLASAVHSEGMLAAAMVIAPQRSERSVAAFDWSLATGPSQPLALQSDAARALQGNSLADALPIYEALARGGEAQLALPLSARLALHLSIRPLA
ncbi:beta-ketoacyl synthase chain length factor [Variovorax soli]|uniref:beta-ketoacyl synthase chain length factor n=2 Tax=Variovorax soli TaxID=376815 RepID=UPI003608D6D8